jgi:hypothetical protein
MGQKPALKVSGKEENDSTGCQRCKGKQCSHFLFPMSWATLEIVLALE